MRKPFREAEIFGKMAQYLGVRYTYEDLALSAAPDSAAQLQAELTPADLATLPADWVADLRQAARRGKSKQIFDLLDQLPPDQAALTEALAMLVHDFRFDKLMTLTQPEKEDNNEKRST